MSVSFARLRFVSRLALLVAAIAGILLIVRAVAAPADGKTTVESTLQIDRVQPRLLNQPKADGEWNDAAYAQFRRMQAMLIRSDRVVKAALNDPKVRDIGIIKRQPDPAAWIAENLKVDFPGDAEIVRISMEGENSQELAAIVNAIAIAYASAIVDSDQAERRRRFEALKQVCDGYNQRLASMRRMLRQLTEELGQDEARTDFEAQLRRRQVELSGSELLRIRLERVAAETKLSRRKSKKDPDAKDLQAIVALEEAVEILSKQAAFLKEQESRPLKEQRIDHDTQALETIQEQIRASTEILRRVAAEAEAANVELEAPPRIRLLSRADTRPGGRNPR